MATHIVNKRTAHRWNLLAMIVLGVFFAFGSFWLLQLMQASDPDAQLGGPPNEPDYIVENFSFVRMTENGQPSYLLSGKRLEHIPEGDVSHVDAPLLRGVDPARPPMTVVAKNARIHHEEHRVELIGDVDLQRPKTAAAEALRVRTQALTVLPDEEILKTDQPIEMQLGASSVKGTGMVANNATQQLHLSSRGQIVYPPRPR
ncbi:LPS export ABC transporter periplasmic protein LptC [Massilia sp. YIM B02443]|uniref:LPS export ABC transporter periplasmic protein LptC n=1 Tax=Massilia sp. YIM B02443 TaxID=3050127 RepID=UPI0025B637FB|nr:LPS export ABC transporter periplasmic protein LptC [Massilia sp. YIM B02443]MDN4037901.1 LPS export ABC transporter periplasmic protein LptC [Massilia sp. YIM B02443]